MPVRRSLETAFCRSLHNYVLPQRSRYISGLVWYINKYGRTRFYPVKQQWLMYELKLRRAVCDMTHIRARACCVSPHPFGNDKSGYYVLEIGTSITPDRRIELDIIFDALNFRPRPRMSEEKRERNRRAIPVGNLSRSTIFIYKRAALASNWDFARRRSGTSNGTGELKYSCLLAISQTEFAILLYANLSAYNASSIRASLRVWAASTERELSAAAELRRRRSMEFS